MAIRLEQLLTGVNGTLASGITNVATSMTIDSATGWPTTGDFRVLIGNETILVTAVSGVTWTIERAADGSTAASHSTSEVVTHLLTKGALDTIRRDNDPGHLTRDPYRLQDVNGDPLTHTDFTEVNFATNNAVASTNDGNVRIAKDDHVGHDVSMLVLTAPSTPYTITGAITHNAWGDSGGDGPRLGLCFYETSSGSLIVCEIMPGSTAGYRITYYTSTTAFSSNLFAEPAGEHEPHWMKIEDDGTNLNFYHSMSGYDFTDIFHTELRGSFFTTGPDRVGLCFNNIAGIDGGFVDLVAWNQR